MNPIASQQRLLADALEAAGWKLIDRETNLAHWAYYEVWTIESRWRPAGLRAFIGFLYDPQPSSPGSPTRRSIWAAECNRSSPLETGGRLERLADATLTHWRDGIAGIVEGLARFRDQPT